MPENFVDILQLDPFVVGEVEVRTLKKQWTHPKNVLLSNIFNRLQGSRAMSENYNNYDDQHLDCPNDGDEDIYGDLESAVFSSAHKQKRSSLPRQELEDSLQRARQEIAELKERVTELSKQNLNLVNNFSMLLKTAKEDKKKSIATITELRNQLKRVATASTGRRTSLSKDEIHKINEYCSTVVEESLQFDITYDVVKKAIEDSKTSTQERKSAHLKRPWSKQIKFDNMSLYLSREQIPFQRIEPVTYLNMDKSNSNSKKPPENSKSNNSVVVTRPR